jgi:rhomboid protease GluP
LELNRILLLIVGLSIATTLWRSIVVFPIKYNRGWVIVSVIIVICTTLGLMFAPQNAGIIAGIFWILLIVIPTSTEKIAQNLALQNRYRRAIWIARIASLLHPFDGWWLIPRFYEGRRLESEGSFTEATQIFDEFKQHEQLGFAANTALFTMYEQWEEYILWLETHKQHEIKHDATVMSWYLRALGEVGALNKMLDWLSQYRSTLEKVQGTLYACYMTILAFCGQGVSVDKLLEYPLSSYSHDRKKFWKATASFTAGKRDEAQTQFTELLNSDDARIRDAAAKRLSHPLPIARNVLTPEFELILQHIQLELDSNLATYSVTTHKRRFAYATLVLIAINIIVFGLELGLGGSTNIETLYQMGALWTPAIVNEGQFWRLITANFLHFGWLHLLLNIYALYILGSNVEIRFGVKWYIFLYAISGIGSMAIAVLLIQTGLMEQMFAVGASGAILGLLGVMAAADFRVWRQTKSALAQNRLRRMLFVILIQIAVKIVVPQVSLTLHLAGVIIGFVATMLIESLNRQSNLSKA